MHFIPLLSPQQVGMWAVRMEFVGKQLKDFSINLESEILSSTT